MTEPTDPAILDWYTATEDESTRLTRVAHGRVELVRTRELVARHLRPEPMDILDVGGATGIHASWLAGLGHRVTLVDPVPAQVERAARHTGVTARTGDARALVDGDDSYDLVLALGPLYHLAARADRVTALAEARRVCRPGGSLLAAAIGRYAVLGEFALFGQLDEATARALMEHYVAHGDNPDDHGFPLRHAHLAEELAAEAQDAGWTDVQVLGVEGPLGVAVDLVPAERQDTSIEQAVRLAGLLESDPRAVDLSPHLMVVGRA